MKKILVPIDGTERSMHSLDFIKEIYRPEDVEIEIINVKELVFVDGIDMGDEIKASSEFGKQLLERARQKLSGYEVNLYFTFGYAGDEIIRKSQEDNIDIIVMTKSTKKGLTRLIGSCTSYVLRNANCIVMIVPE
ncbi:universal stress protein [Peptostreptococcus equinus]|uniref:Universal stress protein n=1 Tax=Peptostreptococcus equinus TaxID=3003601 RepID=A0ABY7JPX0_9FIRM|nr:universal stress protein [Peptostreptococcus sp. CBA3647]WAW15414.1 universal stress protein [Peptostreptococcus sp. CBA3647]